jgi:hypothetical protein
MLRPFSKCRFGGEPKIGSMCTLRVFTFLAWKGVVRLTQESGTLHVEQEVSSWFRIDFKPMDASRLILELKLWQRSNDNDPVLLKWTYPVEGPPPEWFLAGIDGQH